MMRPIDGPMTYVSVIICPPWTTRIWKVCRHLRAHRIKGRYLLLGAKGTAIGNKKLRTGLLALLLGARTLRTGLLASLLNYRPTKRDLDLRWIVG